MCTFISDIIPHDLLYTKMCIVCIILIPQAHSSLFNASSRTGGKEILFFCCCRPNILINSVLNLSRLHTSGIVQYLKPQEES